MKSTKIASYVLTALISVFGLSNCTDLSENLYDRVNSGKFFQTKEDVYRAFLRTFEQAFSTIQGDLYYMQENSADYVMTPNRQGHWSDGGVYARLHYHSWTSQESYTNAAWTKLYQGIAQANNSIEDLETLDIAQFGIQETERSQFIAELRTMRAWYYIKLLDFYRNIPIVTKFKEQTEELKQAEPAETFKFIEKELLEASTKLAKKGDPGTNSFDGRWTKAGALSLLARLYLNAEVYTGLGKYAECAAVCQEIIDAKHGAYSLAATWDAPFDWNNEKSPEMIFGFPSSFSRSPWHYNGGMFRWTAPFLAHLYFGFTDYGRLNPRYSLQPGFDVSGKEYPFALGKPFLKFQKYPDDVRLKIARNLGNSTREGMFLYGYLTYNQNKDTVYSDNGYALYVRDQVGIFNRKVGDKLKSYGPGEIPENKQSDMYTSDQNSGVYYIKYPFYPSTDPHKVESDYAEIRLAEIYYTLAECKFRAGDKAGAAELLNTVRKRNFPADSPSLYKETGEQITEQEILDEWGREFLGEGRRRTDLIRFKKFSQGTWWDKNPDKDNHTDIFPIGESVLGVSPFLKQNPGY